MKSDVQKFEQFRKAHSSFIVLPGAADLLAAIMLQETGFPAVATTSVALGYAVGCPQSKAISKDLMFDIVGKICRAVTIPVSIDFEDGYSETTEGVAENTRKVIDLGVVALRIEDSDGIPGKGLRPAEEHAERIRIVRRTADEMGVPLFITGRSDPFWNDDGVSVSDKADESVRRGNIYVEAGADAIFVSSRLPMSRETVATLVGGIKAPFATMYNTSGLSIAELKELGVRRLSMGALAISAQLGFLEEGLKEVMTHGTTDLFSKYKLPPARMSGLVDKFWSENPA